MFHDQKLSKKINLVCRNAKKMHLKNQQNCNNFILNFLAFPNHLFHSFNSAHKNFTITKNIGFPKENWSFWDDRQHCILDQIFFAVANQTNTNRSEGNIVIQTFWLASKPKLFKLLILAPQPYSDWTKIIQTMDLWHHNIIQTPWAQWFNSSRNP